MSKVKLGINGFGRIGRIVFRETFNRDNVEVVAINDLLDVDHLAYLLKYDSVHGRFNGTVEVKEGKLFVNGRNIRITAEMITFLAPPLMCSFAVSIVVKIPVHSATTSTSTSFHFKSAGFLSAVIRIFLPYHCRKKSS